mmetsp:Transcript_41122/g.98728  ORF Transcript_41122/g.98728 Transcript_41122/m.98728 type:complete len:280 (-) Transcript_41122:140-979(-)
MRRGCCMQASRTVVCISSWPYGLCPAVLRRPLHDALNGAVDADLALEDLDHLGERHRRRPPCDGSRVRVPGVAPVRGRRLHRDRDRHDRRDNRLHHRGLHLHQLKHRRTAHVALFEAPAQEAADGGQREDQDRPKDNARDSARADLVGLDLRGPGLAAARALLPAQVGQRLRAARLAVHVVPAAIAPAIPKPSAVLVAIPGVSPALAPPFVVHRRAVRPLPLPFRGTVVQSKPHIAAPGELERLLVLGRRVDGREISAPCLAIRASRSPRLWARVVAEA